MFGPSFDAALERRRAGPVTESYGGGGGGGYGYGRESEGRGSPRSSGRGSRSRCGDLGWRFRRAVVHCRESSGTCSDAPVAFTRYDRRKPPSLRSSTLFCAGGTLWSQTALPSSKHNTGQPHWPWIIQLARLHTLGHQQPLQLRRHKDSLGPPAAKRQHNSRQTTR